jgi:hypothetical protein
MQENKPLIITCNLGHEHEIDLPDDLITPADSARLVNRSLQSIQNNMDAGRLIGYPATASPNISLYRQHGHRAPRRLLSKEAVLNFYGLPAQAS